MLHGFLSSTAQWDLNVSALGGRHPLILVDLPGHGASPDPVSAAACAPSAIVADLERIRRDERVDRWIVCGQSLGGAVGLCYALAYSEHVSGVVFTNTRAAFGVGRGSAGSPIPDDLRTIRDIGVHPVHATRLPEPLSARLIDEADRVTVDTARFVATHRSSWRSVDRLGELPMPVLLVNGRWESGFQPCVDEARRRIADLTVVDLEGGHAINVEQAAAFDTAVLEWSGGIAGPPPGALDQPGEDGVVVAPGQHLGVPLDGQHGQ